MACTDARVLYDILKCVTAPAGGGKGAIMILRSYGETDFVTGLRAIAALMVLAIHTGAFIHFGEIGRNITANCQQGVPIFFVISGFAIALISRNNPSYRTYLIQRMFRIAPLYYLAVAISFALILTGITGPGYYMTLYGSEPDLYNAFMHFTFLSGWDVRVANSIIGIEWTVPVEIFWYLLMPFILPFTKSRKSCLIALGICLFASGLTRAIGALWLPPHAAHFMPITYGAYFVMGAACLPLREIIEQKGETYRLRVARASALLFVIGMVTDTGFANVMISVSVAMAIVSLRISPGQWHPLTSKVLLFFGSVSYSLYLSHLIIIRLIAKYAPEMYPEAGLQRFLLVTAISSVVAAVFYILVEKPTNQMGKWLTRPSTKSVKAEA